MRALDDHDRPDEGMVGRLFLTFGQAVSVLGCIASPIYALAALTYVPYARERGLTTDTNPWHWVVLGAHLSFLYCAAMFVVFARCKRVPAA